MDALNQEHFYVLVFVGATQTKVSYEVASALQEMGEKAEYIKISGSGNNALDFHIAYYIGKIAAVEPDSYFHIISKDTGFDPLIQHLKSKKMHASRSKTIADIPLIKISNSKSASERAAAVIANLTQRGASKPRAVNTLGSTINALFHKSLSESEIATIIKEMVFQGYISVSETKVTYTLNQEEKLPCLVKPQSIATSTSKNKASVSAPKTIKNSSAPPVKKTNPVVQLSEKDLTKETAEIVEILKVLSRPSNIISLKAIIKALPSLNLTNQEVGLVIQNLQDYGLLVVSGEKVTYKL